MRRLSVLFAAALLLAGCEPVFVFAGGALSGPVETPPADWAFSESESVVQIETRPPEPYSVNVWGVGVGDRFYVAASDGGSSAWAQAIEADPMVRLRVGEDVYELAAVRVDDAAELDEVAGAYVSKYEVDAQENFVGGAWVYRLERR